MARLHRFILSRAFTLIELLVVIAIIAVLMGLLLPAVQKVRESAARTLSTNNIKQLCLATHNYHDTKGHFPPYYSDSDSGQWSAGMTYGNAAFQLFPYIEQDNLFKTSYQEWIYTEMTPWSNTKTDYNYKAYQGGKIKGRVKTLISPSDPTANDVDSPLSYLPNDYVMSTWMSLNKIMDGTSNTMLFAEGYSYCKTVDTTPWGSYTYTRNGWNNDTSTYIYPTNPPDTYRQDPFFDPYGWGTWENGNYNRHGPFQVRPRPEDCRYESAQALTSFGLLVGMCDGSVRSVSANVKPDTFYAAGTPQGGDIIGNDW